MNQRHIRWCAVVLFVMALCALWMTRGAHYDKEAVKYIGCAQDLLGGETHDLFGSYKAYAAYVLFLVPFVAAHALWLAVIAQAALAVAAAFSLARSAERISGDERTGTVAMVILLMCYPLQEWVLALYTESFFASIAMLFLERASRPERFDPWTWVLAAVLMCARPNGMLIVAPLLIWRAQWPVRTTRVLRPVVCTALVAIVLWLPGVARHQLGTVVEAHVICGFPERPGALSAFQGTNLLDAQAFLFREPAYATGLFVRRVVSLFTLHRPYYSVGHNLSLAPLYLLYPLAVLGWWRWRNASMVGALTAVVLLNAGLIGFTYDEWNGRFLVPIWPVIAVFAAMGSMLLLDRFPMAPRSTTRTA